MQLELLKRDKLDYTFQSLSIISILPMLFLEPLKYWAVNQFGMTAIEEFYNGKPGMIIQILVLVITFICYTLIRIKFRRCWRMPQPESYTSSPKFWE